MDDTIESIPLDPSPAYTASTPTVAKAIPLPEEKTRFLTAVPLDQLKDGSVPVDCPACGVRVLTRIEHKSGGLTGYVIPYTSRLAYVFKWFNDPIGVLLPLVACLLFAVY
jgi:hypothetical protein